MALNVPYLRESNFELGDNSEWDSEVDTGSLLNFVHYSKLSRYRVTEIGAIAPWRGAYVAEWNLGDTNDHTLIKATTDVVADGKIGFVQFMLFIGKDFTATADDTLAIYEAQGTANAVEGTICLKITAATGVIQIGHAQKQADIVFGGDPLQRGRWYCIELVDTIVVGTATGATQLFIDGSAFAASVTNAAVNTPVLRSVLGTQDTLATTTGHLFMDAFKFSSNAASASTTRIGNPKDRYPDTVFVTKSGHLALGQTDIMNVQLLPGNDTTAVLKIYDTDNADLQSDENVVATLNGTTASAAVDLANVPVTVKRGVYFKLTGTIQPQAFVTFGQSQGWRSHGRIRQHGYNRAAHQVATQ